MQGRLTSRSMVEGGGIAASRPVACYLAAIVKEKMIHGRERRISEANLSRLSSIARGALFYKERSTDCGFSAESDEV